MQQRRFCGRGIRPACNGYLGGDTRAPTNLQRLDPAGRGSEILNGRACRRVEGKPMSRIDVGPLAHQGREQKGSGREHKNGCNSRCVHPPRSGAPALLCHAAILPSPCAAPCCGRQQPIEGERRSPHIPADGRFISTRPKARAARQPSQPPLRAPPIFLASAEKSPERGLSIRSRA